MPAHMILDLDGPILDGRRRQHAVYAEILSERGYVPLGVDEYWQMKRERLPRDQQLAASGAEAIYREFLNAWLERIEQPRFLAFDRLQDGAIEALRRWRAAGVTLVLATMRQDSRALREQLAALGVLPLLDQVVVSAHADGGKGKADDVREQVPGLDPGTTVWIGDTEADVEAARHLGCPVWAVTCGIRTQAYLASLAPDFVSPDIASIDLAAACATGGLAEPWRKGSDCR